MIEINKRSVGMCILLSIVTFGLYNLYWMYLLIRNTRSVQNESSDCAGEFLCYLFVPFYAIYWWYTRGKRVRSAFERYNQHSKTEEIVYLILTIFGLTLVSMAIMQSDFNSFEIQTVQEELPLGENMHRYRLNVNGVRYEVVTEDCKASEIQAESFRS